MSDKRFYKTIERFIEDGFELKDISVDGPARETEYLLPDYNGSGLVIGIFSDGYPDAKCANKILIEYERLFDQWHKCFCRADLPRCKKDFILLKGTMRMLARYEDYYLLSDRHGIIELKF
jgi:hypothetical protein